MGNGTKISELPAITQFKDNYMFVVATNNANYKATYGELGNSIKDKVKSDLSYDELTAKVNTNTTAIVQNTASINSITSSIGEGGSNFTGLQTSFNSLSDVFGDITETKLLPKTGNTVLKDLYAEQGISATVTSNTSKVTTLWNDINNSTDGIKKQIADIKAKGMTPASAEALGAIKVGFEEQEKGNIKQYPVRLVTTDSDGNDLPDSDKNKYKAYVEIPNVDVTTLTKNVNDLMGLTTVYFDISAEGIAQQIPQYNRNNIETISNDLYSNDDNVKAGAISAINEVAVFEKYEVEYTVDDKTVKETRLSLVDGILLDVIDKQDIIASFKVTETEEETTYELSSGIVYDLSVAHDFLSAALSNEIEKLSTDLSVAHDFLSAALSNEIRSKLNNVFKQQAITTAGEKTLAPGKEQLFSLPIQLDGTSYIPIAILHAKAVEGENIDDLKFGYRWIDVDDDNGQTTYVSIKNASDDKTATFKICAKIQYIKDAAN